MTTPADWYPGFEAEIRDRKRVADEGIPIADRVILACHWEWLWSVATDFAAGIPAPDERSNALRCYTERREWWYDAVETLAPHLESADDD